MEPAVAQDDIAARMIDALDGASNLQLYWSSQKARPSDLSDIESYAPWSSSGGSRGRLGEAGEMNRSTDGQQIGGSIADSGHNRPMATDDFGVGCLRTPPIPFAERSMQLRSIVPLALIPLSFMGATASALAQSEPYPAMAPLDQYLMPEADEVALARSAAPKAVSDEAEVMVLRKEGFVTAAKGTNNFLCLVERGWAGDSSFSDFWNPRQRAPICFNPAAAKTYAPIFLMKPSLALAGKSKKEIVETTSAALDKKVLPTLAPGAMCYMMSKQQYLNDEGKSWRPHLMVFVQGDVAKSWGANVDGSPVMAANVAEERVTIFMITVEHWSDGSPAPSMNH